MIEMQYTFQSAEDFIDEVKAFVKDETIEENLVRLQIEKQQTRGGVLTRYAVRAGFVRGNGDLFQFYEEVGETPCKAGDPNGADEAAALHSIMMTSLNSLGVTIRKGQCVG